MVLRPRSPASTSFIAEDKKLGEEPAEIMKTRAVLPMWQLCWCTRWLDSSGVQNKFEGCHVCVPNGAEVRCRASDRVHNITLTARGPHGPRFAAVRVESSDGRVLAEENVLVPWSFSSTDAIVKETPQQQPQQGRRARHRNAEWFGFLAPR